MVNDPMMEAALRAAEADILNVGDPDPLPWGEKDPYRLIRKEVPALVRAKVITPAEGRKALGLPPIPDADTALAPQAPPRPPQSFTAAYKAGYKIGAGIVGLFGPHKRHRRRGSHYLAHRAMRLLEHKATGRH